jgi:pyruvate-formate lyase-activating enzyme
MQAVEKKPGTVAFKVLNNVPQLDDLWFMTGSRCNLSCAHCYVGSSPTNDTLQQIALSDVMPFVEEAKEFNVQHIYFTGGEPFINKEIMPILSYCLSVADVTVLTNATLPIETFLSKLQELNDSSPHDLSFRISLDHYDEEKHDAIRGKGNFKKTVQNAVALGKRGFTPIITATAVVYEDNPLSASEIEKEFKKVFLEHGLCVEVKLLPYTLEMGTNLARVTPSKHVFISEDCMKKPGIMPENFQCHNGRTIQKIDGRMVVYPCPIIYDDKQFELASTLKESFDPVALTHKACYDFCYRSGGKCTN